MEAAKTDELYGAPEVPLEALELHPSQPGLEHGRAALFAKRALDLVVASILLLLFAPLLLICAIAIRLDSPGPILFRQRRVGRDGKVFDMLKFRTMEEGADELRGALRHINENDGILFKSSHDPRVTRVGRWLRPLSIDELPQLLQVLTGTMSLVGPRAMPPDMDILIDEPYRHQRLALRSGVTGAWQIDRTERRRSIQAMARMDVEYINSWSLGRDLRIMVATIFYVLLRRGI